MMNAKQDKSEKRPVVFLDRDGTLNIEAGYIKELENLNLIDGAAEAVKRLNMLGIKAILVTNQTGAARDYYPEAHILALNERLEKLLAEQGAFLDAVYYCPHLPAPDAKIEKYARECDCRKPAVGMVEQAYREHDNLDRALSFVVGDKATDVELAKNCGARGVLVETGYGERVQKGDYQWPVEPDFQARSISEAVDWIISVVNENIQETSKKLD
ncbi:MAG: HAD family hydrolase [Cyanobacteriota/Melainabacteria group bacterium]